MSPELASSGSAVEPGGDLGRACQAGRARRSGSRRARRIEAAVAERDAAVDAAGATSRWMVVNSNDSAGTGAREAGQCLRLEAFDVDLDEGRHAVARDQRIERRDRNVDGAGPGLSLPAGRAVGGRTKAVDAVETVGLARLSLSATVPGAAADGGRLDRSTVAIAAIEQRAASCASAGCGSTATTRAPSLRKAATRSPTWAPMSNTRSPALTKRA